MKVSTLFRLLCREHLVSLCLLFLTALSIGFFNGVASSQNWQSFRGSEREMYVSQKSDTPNGAKIFDSRGNYYNTKAEYQDQVFQVYRKTIQGENTSTRNSWTSYNYLYFILAVIAGVAMVTIDRKQHFIEFLQVIGFKGHKVFFERLGLYGGILSLSVFFGKVLTNLMMYSNIPHGYFKYFTWENWFENIIADLMVVLFVLTLVAVINLVIPNYVISTLIGLLAYFGWSTVWAIINGVSDAGRQYANYFSTHYWLGMTTTVLLFVLALWVGYKLSDQFSSERQGDAVAIPQLRFISWGILGTLSSLICGNFLTLVLFSISSVGIYLIVTIISFLIVTIWMYRPKWSQRLWNMLVELR